MSMELKQAAAECAALVKAENLDAWLATLLAPERAQAALLAQWAVVAEVTRLPWRLSEGLLARLRGEWWREALLELADGAGRAGGAEKAAGAGEADGTEKAEGARQASEARQAEGAAGIGETSGAGAAGQGGASAPPLRILRATGHDVSLLAQSVAHLSLLADSIFTTAPQAAAFAREAFTPLLTSLARTLDVEANPARLADLAQAFGAAFLLRRLPYPRATQPAALMPQAAARELAEQALAACAAARRRAWPRPWLPALWPASLSLQWLKKAARHPAFPMQPVPAPGQLRRQLALLRLRLAGGV